MLREGFEMKLGVGTGLRKVGMFALCVACGPAVATDESGVPEGSTSAATSTSMVVSGASTDAPTTVTPDTSGASVTSEVSTVTSDAPEPSSEDSSGESGDAFITDPTRGCGGGALPDGVLGHCTLRCSVWYQDCPEGEACKAWANNGTEVWNGSRCTPLDEAPGQRGEPCSAEAVPTSGFDSCDEGLMCWNVGGDALEGACAAYCAGTEDDPVCEDSLDTCSIFNDGALPLCLPACDPLSPVCDAGSGCYPGSQGNFVCIRQGEAVALEGMFHPECPAGTFAVTDEKTDSCSLEEPCCSAYCDVSADVPCGFDAECVPYFDAPNPSFSNLGFCRPAT